jgi:hypothetical protein
MGGTKGGCSDGDGYIYEGGNPLSAGLFRQYLFRPSCYLFLFLPSGLIPLLTRMVAPFSEPLTSFSSPLMRYLLESFLCGMRYKDVASV